MRSKLWVIFKEVYRKNVQTWAFFFMVFGPIIMFLVMGGIGYLIAQDRIVSSVGNIAVINASPELKHAMEQSNNNNTFQFDLNDTQAKEALMNKEIDGYLVFTSNSDVIEATFYRQTTGKDIELSVFRTMFEQYMMRNKLAELGLTSSQLAYIQDNQPNIHTINLERSQAGDVTEKPADDPVMMISKGIAFIASFVVFFFIMNYASIISQEIAGEKGSRVMEIILSSVSASTHFYGKMLGIAAVILTQFGIYLGIGWIAKWVVETFNLLGFIPVIFDVSVSVLMQALGASAPMLYLVGMYAITGIMIYSCISGFLGSLVSRTEDVQKTISPIVLLGVAGFYIGNYATVSPNNVVVQIGSHIPFFTPFVMPHRLAAGVVDTPEIILSISISIVFAILCLVISTVFYKNNVLIYSDKGLLASLKQSYRLWRSEQRSK